MRIESSYSLATQACHKENISFEEYQTHYKQNNGENGWIERKAEALPCMFIAVVVKTTYHIAIAIIVGIPQCLTCDSKQLRLECSNIYQDFEEAYGCFMMIFDDQKGSYYFERSQFFKEKNVVVLKKDQDFKPSPPTDPKSPDPEDPSIVTQLMNKVVNPTINVVVNPVNKGEDFLLNKESAIFSYATTYPRNLDFLQNFGKYGEEFFRKPCKYDRSVFSSSMVLLMQDIQDIAREARPHFQLRQKFYDKIEALPQILVDTTHGNSQRTVNDNPFAPILSPIAWQASEIIVPKDVLMTRVQTVTEKALQRCTQFEEKIFHATYPRLVNKAIGAVGRFFFNQTIKWWGCRLVVFYVSWGLQNMKKGKGFDYEIMEDDTLISVHYYVASLLWLGLLHLEGKSWKEKHERTHHELDSERTSYAYKMRDKLVSEFKPTQSSKEESGILAKALPYLLEAVGDNIQHPKIEHIPPPSPSPIRETLNNVWNYATSFFSR